MKQINVTSYGGFTVANCAPYLEALGECDRMKRRFEWDLPDYGRKILETGTMGFATPTSKTIQLGFEVDKTTAVKQTVHANGKPTRVVAVANEAQLREAVKLNGVFVRVIGQILLFNPIAVTGSFVWIEGDDKARIVWAGLLSTSVSMFQVYGCSVAFVNLEWDLRTYPVAPSREAPNCIQPTSRCKGLLLWKNRLKKVGCFLMNNGGGQYNYGASDILILDNLTVDTTSLCNNFAWDQGIDVYFDRNLILNSLAEHCVRTRHFLRKGFGPGNLFQNISGAAGGDIVKGTTVLQGDASYCWTFGGNYIDPWDARPLSGMDGLKYPKDWLKFVRVIDADIHCPQNTQATIGHRVAHVYFDATVGSVGKNSPVRVLGRDFDDDRAIDGYGRGLVDDITVVTRRLKPPAGIAPVFIDSEIKSKVKLVA